MKFTKKTWTTPPGDILTPGVLNMKTIIDHSPQLERFLTAGGLSCKIIAVDAPRAVLYKIRLLDPFTYSPDKLKKLLIQFSAFTGVDVRLESTAPPIVREEKSDFTPLVLSTAAAPPSLYTIPIGRGEQNDDVFLNLPRAVHLLIAGTTGSGKSVLLNTILSGFIFTLPPSRLKLILIDPKKVEFSAFTGSPHLLKPVISAPDKIPGALYEVYHMMMGRYTILKKQGLKNINENPGAFPRVVIVIDELADLMLSDYKKIIEQYIIKIAQLGRAAGIHLIVATQRPTKEVLTGLIKANLPSKIALTTSSIKESINILDKKGAENLRGYGEGLYKQADTIHIKRFQSYMAPKKDIKNIVSWWKKQA